MKKKMSYRGERAGERESKGCQPKHDLQQLKKLGRVAIEGGMDGILLGSSWEEMGHLNTS